MSNQTKRKLTRKEKREIETVIRRAKGDGKPHSAQDSIPFEEIYPDGLCKLNDKSYSKCIEFEDVNYQLAGADDKTAVFENLCDFYNYYDASIGIQLSLISRYANKEDFQKTISIPPQGDDFDGIRAEYTAMLQGQLARGNNGLIKTKFLTLTIQADNIQAARSRLGRIEADTLNHFKVMGAAARVLDGRQRLSVLHGIFHPDGERFNFEWDWLPASGLSPKDFIAPSSFHFGANRTFRMGKKMGAVSFLQILAPELNDRMLADFMEAEGGIMVNLHIRSIDQNEAIKTIKRKITDLDAMKITEQKKAVRSGYDMDIIPSDLATYGGEAKKLLHELQSRNERMFLLTFLILNFGDTKRKLDNAVFQASGVAQKYNCALTRLDFQQEAGLMSSLPLGLNQINIQRGLTTSSTAIFVPFTTQELFQSGEALYYGLNALSNNMIMADRKKLKNPKGLYCKGRSTDWKTQARAPFAAQMGRQPSGHRQERNRNILQRSMPYSNTEQFYQKDFENSSVLPPVFLLLVRGDNSIPPVSNCKPKNRERSFTVFYNTQPHNSIWKGANAMQSDNKNAVSKCEGEMFTKRIGSTTYVVSVRFSSTSKESIEDKILRLMESEVKQTA